MNVFINKKNIKISNLALDLYIQFYGDSIAHVINEIENLYLSLLQNNYYEANLYFIIYLIFIKIIHWYIMIF